MKEKTKVTPRARDPLFSPFLDALIPKPGDRDFSAFCEWVGIPVKVGKTARGRARIRDQVILTASDAFRD